jgi:ADP-ribose pyrophosphatase
VKKDRSYRKSTIPDNAKCVFEGVIFDVYQWEQALYDGSTTTFERLAGNDIARVIPILDDGHILIINDEQPARPVLTKFPGGYVDPGETPETTMKRELLEETGYEITSYTPLIDVAPWNKIDYRRTYFVGRGAHKVSESKVQAGERVTVRLVSFDEMVSLLADGGIDDTVLQIIALQALTDSQKMEELKKSFFG